MPTQFFKVTRAPEAGETTAQEIKHALMDVRDDTEWDVKEFRQFESRFSGLKEVYEPYKDGEPCSHPGCSQHLSHPCEGCGRYLSRGESFCDASIMNCKCGGRGCITVVESKFLHTDQWYAPWIQYYVRCQKCGYRLLHDDSVLQWLTTKKAINE